LIKDYIILEKRKSGLNNTNFHDCLSTLKS